MGKRRVVFISSSEEEESEDSRRKEEETTTRTGGCSSYGRGPKCPRKRFVSARSSANRSSSEKELEETRMKDGGTTTRTGGCSSSGRKRIVRARSSADRSSCTEGMVDFESLSDDFSECLNGLHSVPGLRKTTAKELWVDKHKPQYLGELAVHKKKVSEIRKWLEDRMSMPKEEYNSNVLLVTGQAGSGKSVAIHLLASQLGIELYEWTTPTPTLWQEHVHNSQSGLRYISKLDEFESFVEHIRKYPVLPSMSRSGHRKPVFLLIDDIPVTNGRVSHERLSKCLHLLVRSAHVPTIILLTQYPKDEAGDRTTCHLEDLEASVGRAGACKVSLNPLTMFSIKKTLFRIRREEKCNVPEEWIDLIARTSGGDIRHAISALQYFCIEPRTSFDLSPTNISSYSSLGNRDRNSLLSVSLDGKLDNALPLFCGKEESISLFHALGKFLHNKREMEDNSESSPFALHERFKRSPLKMDSPENILCQAHGQSRQIADFLHENVLDFLDNEAIGDAWIVTSYLSDADCLLATGPHSSRRQKMIDYEPGLILQSAAASVAVRGVLFGNSRPLTSRWHTIRRPYLWQIEQSRHSNKNRMMVEKFGCNTSFGSSSISDMATDFLPTTKWLGCRTQVDANSLERTTQNAFKVEKNSALDPNSLTTVCLSPDIEEEDDEIEDWGLACIRQVSYAYMEMLPVKCHRGRVGL